MDQLTLRAFLKKLAVGNYTRREYELFTEWVDNATREEYEILLQNWQEVLELQENFAPVDSNVIVNIESCLDHHDLDVTHTKQFHTDKGRIFALWKRFVVAASVLIVLAAGVYVRKHAKQPQQAAFSQNFTNNIAPGKTTATLTLANGKKIKLQDAIQGEIAKEAGVSVTKTANGQIVYTVAANDNSKESQFNTLSTAEGETYKINLPDGTLVWLNAASSLTYPTLFSGRNRKVELKGEGYFEVTKNREKPFIVNANGAEIKVLGTHFNISAYSDDPEITATLIEGSIQMRHSGKTVVIKPGQKGVTSFDQDNITVQDADIEHDLAWKNGNFSFRDASIQEAMKLASRWYSVEVSYLDNTIKGKKLRGTVSRYRSITELLDNISLTSGIHYKIEGRKIILMK